MSTPERSPYAVSLDDLERRTRVPREEQVSEVDSGTMSEELPEVFPQLARPWSLS